MASCVYDNPHTLCREWWADGVQQASITARVFARGLHWGSAPWEPGRLVGSFYAIIPHVLDESEGTCRWIRLLNGAWLAPCDHTVIFEGDTAWTRAFRGERCTCGKPVEVSGSQEEK